MVNLLIGPKGSGKTVRMFDLANSSSKEINGNVVFIKNSRNETQNLSHEIRVIIMKDYDSITSVDEYIGFLYGMMSCNHDIQAIYIDGLLKIGNVHPEDLEYFVNRVKTISIEKNVDFFVSCSISKEAFNNVEGCTILN